MGAQSVSEGMIAGAAILVSISYVLYLTLLIFTRSGTFLIDTRRRTYCDWGRDQNRLPERLRFLLGMPTQRHTMGD